jgi:hypothetical protein
VTGDSDTNRNLKMNRDKANSCHVASESNKNIANRSVGKLQNFQWGVQRFQLLVG